MIQKNQKRSLSQKILDVCIRIAQFPHSLLRTLQIEGPTEGINTHSMNNSKDTSKKIIREEKGLREFEIQVLLVDRIVGRDTEDAIEAYKRWIATNNIPHCEIQKIKEVGKPW